MRHLGGGVGPLRYDTQVLPYKPEESRDSAPEMTAAAVDDDEPEGRGSDTETEAEEEEAGGDVEEAADDEGEAEAEAGFIWSDDEAERSELDTFDYGE